LPAAPQGSIPSAPGWASPRSPPMFRARCCDPRYFLQGKLESGLKEGPDDEAIEVHIIAVLREQEAGVSTAEVCRKHGISTATFYGWKAKFGGMEVSEAKRLKQLEDENAKLKRLLADAMLDNAALKDLMTKKF
jgi:putative transposase